MAEVLADTSVWIEALRGRLKPPLAGIFTEAVLARAVVLTDVVRTELLVGTRNKKEFDWLRRHLSPFKCLSIRTEERDSFEAFAWKLAREGFPGKYTDATIAYVAHRNRLPLIALDGYFEKLGVKGVISLIEAR